MRRDIESLGIDAIHIGERMRPVADDSRVAALASSIKDIGLQTPISVRFVDSVTIDGEEVSHVPVLIAGRNRLEAARQLGWERIDCFILAADDIEAQLWEIAENLHRVGLTKEERDIHIRRYAELLTEREGQQKLATAKCGTQLLSPVHSWWPYRDGPITIDGERYKSKIGAPRVGQHTEKIANEFNL